jgi:acyl CoA:acetate/3-ketoacid CoA transferase
MEFRPAISSDLREMDARIFRDEPMGLAQRLNPRTRRANPRLIEAGYA